MTILTNPNIKRIILWTNSPSKVEKDRKTTKNVVLSKRQRGVAKATHRLKTTTLIVVFYVTRFYQVLCLQFN